MRYNIKIYYLLSGMDKKVFTKEHTKYLKEDIKNNLVITFIASTFSEIKNK